jgi:hypothetical protein
MKKLSFVLAAVAVTLLVSCGAKDKRMSFKEPAKYNDYIVDIIDGVDEAWTTAIEEENQQKALAWSDTLANRSKSGIAKLNNLQPFKKDSTFRDAGLKYMTHMNKIGNNELKEFINIIRAEEMTVAGEQRAEALIPVLDDEREKLFDEVEKSQNAFADKFHIIIIK